LKKTGERLNTLSAYILGILTLLICADVILRAFRHPIPGSYDITGFLTSIMLSLAMVRSFQAKNHITIDLIDKFVSKTKANIVNLISKAITSVFLGILFLSMISSGFSSKSAGEVSMTLGIPLYLSYIAIGICAGLAFTSEILPVFTKIRFSKEIEIDKEIKELGGERV